MPANCVICGAVCEQRCGRCHAVWYCGAAHQAADWGTHKELCAQLQQYYIKQLPTSFSLVLVRQHMPRSYYDGYKKALANLSCVTFSSTDSLPAKAWAERLSECEKQCIALEDARRYQTEIGPQRLELAVRMANQRIAATQILLRTDAGTTKESSTFLSRSATVLDRFEQQVLANSMSQEPFDAMRKSDLLAQELPTAYYCGVFDAHCSVVESLMEESVAQQAMTRDGDILASAAIAMYGVAIMVCKERLREALEFIANKSTQQMLAMRPGEQQSMH